MTTTTSRRASHHPCDTVDRVTRTQWIVHGEHIVDENRNIRLSTVDIELPDRTMPKTSAGFHCPPLSR